MENDVSAASPALTRRWRTWRGTAGLCKRKAGEDEVWRSSERCKYSGTLLCVEFPLPLSYTHRQYRPTHVLGLLQHGSCFSLNTEIQRLAFLKLHCAAVFCTIDRIAASNSGTVRTEWFKAQWSPYVQSSGHYVYSTVVTMCTAQWSPYVQPCGHYVYSTAVNLCTDQWSLHVQPSSQYVYSPVVNMCTAQWSP